LDVAFFAIGTLPWGREARPVFKGISATQTFGRLNDKPFTFGFERRRDMWQMVINLFFRNFEIPGQLDGGHFHDIEK
jgi:hypothetical protein